MCILLLLVRVFWLLYFFYLIGYKNVVSWFLRAEPQHIHTLRAYETAF